MKAHSILNAALACGIAVHSASALSDPFMLTGGYGDWQRVDSEHDQTLVGLRQFVARVTPGGEAALPFDKPSLLYQFSWDGVIHSTVDSLPRRSGSRP
jgi:hypothetical protein